MHEYEYNTNTAYLVTLMIVGAFYLTMIEKEICLPFVKMVVVLIRCESEDWKKLWHRLHSQPVFRSLASPATPLVWRPRRTFAQPLLFHILRVARVHIRFCPP